MIQISAPILQRNDWKNQLANAIRDPRELLRQLELPVDLPFYRDPQFPLRVPLSYVNRMKKGDPADPLFRQVFPFNQESMSAPHYSPDPVGDLKAQVAPGLIHKYHGRALLTLTGACAIHCRYCFRRHFPYTESNPLQQHWPEISHYLSTHTELHEIILSGGDPLSLSDAKLRQLLETLSQYRHLKTLRIHSRLPIVLPARVTPSLIDALSRYFSRVVLVVHANHAQEIDKDVESAMKAFAKAGITLLNQSVLLRGINDCAETLASLSHALFQCQVLPYYLHQLDRVSGAGHYEVDTQTARHIIRSLRNQLPGYLVPEFVVEKAGAASKIPLT